jgi:hypothetical protein
MPIVNGKHYPYTPSGIARAKKKKGKFSWEDVHVKEVKSHWLRY